MRRTTALWLSQKLDIITSRNPPIAAGSLFFADRAVKVTRATIPGSSFICTPALLACRCPDASAKVSLATEEKIGAPVAKVQLSGMCAVSLFRSQRLAFHCAGEPGRTQRHELGLQEGDMIALLGGSDLLSDWRSVERTLSSVAHEDLEYIAEELLLVLGRNTRRVTANSSNNKELNSWDEEGRGNGICVMAAVHNRPSGGLPQPPTSMEFPGV
ncbi:uncharacterized protein TM35_000064590 [Trypanosoma theileri]|uniref:Protein phosphatase 2C n=1 Tax=Trypanosoma theileri TaxID=67003 RepID=A0A1X0P3D7_9TRYP|nr:uncharacterized protein TM35_000064590 [Trypanosoma theileri]ORC91454.1 hypothetical protein TM35_000064590 [Trypanosoma theileri]